MSDEQVVALVRTALHFVEKEQLEPHPLDVLRVYGNNLKNAHSQLAAARSPD
ncbi:MAG: hypothetical protein ACLQBK_10400 [Candidatus Sulfotelmatobacter sp.]